MSLVEDARDWLLDVFPIDDDESILDLSESAIWKSIDRYYSGGIIGFARDGMDESDQMAYDAAQRVAARARDASRLIQSHREIARIESTYAALAEDESYILGSCGCSEYHSADCPILTDGIF